MSWRSQSALSLKVRWLTPPSAVHCSVAVNAVVVGEVVAVVVAVVVSEEVRVVVRVDVGVVVVVGDVVRVEVRVVVGVERRQALNDPSSRDSSACAGWG